MFVSYYISDVL